MATIKLHNRAQAMPEVFPGELLFTLTGTNDIEAVTTNLNLYFQKLWIYPGKAVSGSTGKLTANTAQIYFGKSGTVAPVTLTQLEANIAGGILQNTVARAYAANHGFAEGATVTIAGATPAIYNGTFPIKNVTASTFEYQLASAPTGPATVMPTATRVQYCPDALQPTDLPTLYELPLGQKMQLSQIIVTGTTGDGLYLQWT